MIFKYQICQFLKKFHQEIYDKYTHELEALKYII